MRIKFTDECLKCGKHHDGGGMTGLTSKSNSGNEVEEIHYISLYGSCCREKAIRAAGISYTHSFNHPAWLAFLKAENDAFIQIKTIHRTSNGTETHEVITTKPMLGVLK